MLEVGKGNMPTSSFIPWLGWGGENPHDPYLSGPHSEMNKSLSLASAPSVFQTGGSKLYLQVVFVLLSL